MNHLSSGNPIASLITKLDLAHDRVTVRLPNALYSGDTLNGSTKVACLAVGESIDMSTSKKKKKQAKDSQLSSAETEKISVYSSPFVEATIDLTQSAFSNARIMYADREAAKRKQEKAEAASAMVIRKVEAQVMKNLAAMKLKTELHSARKVHWFEKFNWFVSTEGYLVISGRDAMQSDIIMKKHLRPGDVYVHADIKGAVPWVVRRKPDGHAISLYAIQEASNAAVCRSAAWGTKTVLSAWWVPGEFVSKMSEYGDKLPQGDACVSKIRVCALFLIMRLLQVCFLFLARRTSFFLRLWRWVLDCCSRLMRFRRNATCTIGWISSEIFRMMPYPCFLRPSIAMDCRSSILLRLR